MSQQIDSFNEFLNMTMQELVDESQTLILDQNIQHTGRSGDVTVSPARHGAAGSGSYGLYGAGGVQSRD